MKVGDITRLWRYRKLLICTGCMVFIIILENIIILLQMSASGDMAIKDYRDSRLMPNDPVTSISVKQSPNQGGHLLGPSVANLSHNIHIEKSSMMRGSTRRISSSAVSIVSHENETNRTEFYFYRKRETKINAYNYSVMISPQPLCPDNTYMMILIHSFHTRVKQRAAIRSTWGSVASTNGSWPGIGSIPETLRLVFILGLHPDPGLNDVALEESERYGDIVVGNFIDSYRNMTLKSLLGLKLVKEQCSKVRYLLKSDDDMFVNLPYLIDILNTRQLHRAIMGPYIEGAKVRRSGKWAMSREDFPMTRYPPYEAGAAYIITGDIVPDLFNTAEYVPPIFIDDVYITGILATILNITHVRQNGFAYATSAVPSACDIILRRIVTGTKASPQILSTIWTELQKHTACS